MATLFLDFENGNDNYGGTSFNLLASGTDGRISTATFSSATANFPNDGSLINQYLSIFNGTIYVIYQITAWISSTSLTIAAISGGTALANQSVDRQYYIGGRWKTISSGVTAIRTIPGDTIRVMGSPAPTSLGINGTWTSAKSPATVNISSSTNASPIAITTSSAHGYSTGDTIVISGHTTNTNANGIWNIIVTGSTTFTLTGSTGNGVGTGGTSRLRNNNIVTLASSVTQNIASFGNIGNGRTAWTASSNVTATLLTTDFKEGNCSDSIAIGASFVTGKAAYKTTGTLDLSGYQQISFWIKQTSGTVSVAGDISLRLCTDTVGDTTAHTFNIEGLAILNAWTPITINLGTNLNNSIQSIALYVDADKGAQTFLISNIIACKAASSNDSLTLQSLIGKNTSNETWWAIQSINNTRVVLETLGRGYYGTSETVTAHKRETIKTTLASAPTTNIVNINESGTSGNTIKYEFGYDRTNMSTQNLETWLDGRNGNGNGINLTSISYVTFNKIACIRYTNGFNMTGQTSNNVTINSGISFSFNSGYGLYFTNGTNTLTFNSNNLYIDWIVGNLYGLSTVNNIYTLALYNCKLYSNSNFVVYFNSLGQGTTAQCTIDGCVFANNNVASINFLGAYNNIINNCTFIDNTGSNMQIDASLNNTIKSCAFTNSSTHSIILTSASNNNKFYNCSSSGNASCFLLYGGQNNYLYNFSIGEATEFGTGFNNYPLGNCRIYSHNHDNTPNNHIISFDYGTIQSNSSVRNTNSGISWALRPTNAARSSTYPLDFEIAKVAVNANSLVAVKAWVRRSNIALTMGLRIKGGQIAGVTNDITSYMTAAADTWEQITLTFTPTEVGVVEILAECYGGTTNTGYIDDISITQV